MSITMVFEREDRGNAMLRWILRHVGTLEVPITYPVPAAIFLPDTMPRFPRKHDQYYIARAGEPGGGTHWRDRWIVKEAAEK